MSHYNQNQFYGGQSDIVLPNSETGRFNEKTWFENRSQNVRPVVINRPYITYSQVGEISSASPNTPAWPFVGVPSAYASSTHQTRIIYKLERPIKPFLWYQALFLFTQMQGTIEVEYGNETDGNTGILLFRFMINDFDMSEITWNNQDDLNINYYTLDNRFRLRPPYEQTTTYTPAQLKGLYLWAAEIAGDETGYLYGVQVKWQGDILYGLDGSPSAYFPYMKTLRILFNLNSETSSLYYGEQGLNGE